MLQFDGAAGLLFPGGPQTVNPNYFAVPDGLYGYFGFDSDCLDFASNTAKNLAPKTTGQNVIDYVTPGANSNTAGYTVIAMDTITNGTVIYGIGISRTTPQVYNVKIALANGGASYTFVVSQSFSHGGTGWEYCFLSPPYSVPASGNYSLGVYSASTEGECGNSSVGRAYINSDATGTVTLTEESGTRAVQGMRYITVGPTDGVLNGFTAASVVNAQVDQGLTFNGSSSYVDLTRLVALNSQTQSISLWLPNKGTNKTAYLIARNPNVDQYANLGMVYVGGQLQFCSRTYVVNMCSWASITNGDHLCLILNYPTWKLYRNAALVNSGTASVAFNNNASIRNVSIGRAGAYNNYYFDGVMDDMRIYDRALDQGEVIELYKAGLADYGLCQADALCGNQGARRNPDRLDDDSHRWRHFAFQRR